MITANADVEISARKFLDLYGAQKLIGYSDINAEFGAKGQMHVYGGTSKITALSKIEYWAPDMNRLPEKGAFEYTKEKQVMKILMTDENFETVKDCFKFEESTYFLVRTRNYETGEQVRLTIEGETEEGKKVKGILEGTVEKDGCARIKDISFEKPQEEQKPQTEGGNKGKENKPYPYSPFLD